MRLRFSSVDSPFLRDYHHNIGIAHIEVKKGREGEGEIGRWGVRQVGMGRGGGEMRICDEHILNGSFLTILPRLSIAAPQS